MGSDLGFQGFCCSGHWAGIDGFPALASAQLVISPGKELLSYSFTVVGIEPGVSQVQGKHSTTKLHPPDSF